ncbi:MAG TPA: GntR family transcriptional regulator [Chloroflexota bacterium]|nr:GntR family transcriptional regulator [Chloroflexota bacterium]
MKSTLQKGISAPIYLQLQNLIRGHISDGIWQPGQAIPSEATLVRQFGIARMTVRQALEGLIREGLLIRERGRGTFVARPRAERELTRMHGFSEDMRVRGMVPSARLVSRAVVPAPAGVSTDLRLGKREAVIYLQRLRLADELPMALESSYLNYDLCHAVLDADLESGSLYVFLQETIGLRLCYASQELEAAFPSADTAALLEMSRRQPVLIIRQTTYMRIGEEDIPGITGSTVYRADRYRFRMQVPR